MLTVTCRAIRKADANDHMAAVTCMICCDEVPRAGTVPICAQSHRFCVECAWNCCKSALGDGLVPACPHEKQAQCGTISKETACEALTRWLRDAVTREERQARKGELQAGGWEPYAHAEQGFSSSRLEAVYLSAERARQGAVQCAGKQCEAWYVPRVPHATEPQRIECTRASCHAVFCAACRTPWHERSSCAEALRLHARWCRFLQEELAAFLMAAR